MCHKGNTICVANGSIENHLSKGDFLGACVSTKLATSNKSEPENLETGQKLNVYPNPVSNSATISFSLLQQGKVSIQIFDLSGRLVKTLANTEMQEGTHQLTWNTRNEKITAGVYFLEIVTKEYAEIKKLLIVK